MMTALICPLHFAIHARYRLIRNNPVNLSGLTLPEEQGIWEWFCTEFCVKQSSLGLGTNYYPLSWAWASILGLGQYPGLGLVCLAWASGFSTHGQYLYVLPCVLWRALAYCSENQRVRERFWKHERACWTQVRIFKSTVQSILYRVRAILYRVRAILSKADDHGTMT